MDQGWSHHWSSSSSSSSSSPWSWSNWAAIVLSTRGGGAGRPLIRQPWCSRPVRYLLEEVFPAALWKNETKQELSSCWVYLWSNRLQSSSIVFSRLQSLFWPVRCRFSRSHDILISWLVFYPYIILIISHTISLYALVKFKSDSYNFFGQTARWCPPVVFVRSVSLHDLGRYIYHQP